MVEVFSPKHYATRETKRRCVAFVNTHLKTTPPSSSMPNSIELADLNNKPFYDLNKGETRELPKRAFFYIFAELVASIILYTQYTSIALVNPLLAPILLGSATAALAQLLDQYWRGRFSDSRVAKFLSWGAINGYFTALWVDLLVLRVYTVPYRIIIDQLVGAPLFQLAFTILSSIWDTDHTVSLFSVRTSYLRSLKYSYCFWPFASMAMFFFVPAHLMVVSNCTANFIWNIVLSKIA